MKKVNLAPYVNPLSLRDISRLVWREHIKRERRDGMPMKWHRHVWGEVVMADVVKLPFRLELRTYWQPCDVGFSEQTNWAEAFVCAAMHPGMRIEHQDRELFEDVPNACTAKAQRRRPWRLFNLR